MKGSNNKRANYENKTTLVTTYSLNLSGSGLDCKNRSNHSRQIRSDGNE